MYKILAIVGKSGAGKDRILHEVLAAAPDRFHEIISATTRPPREGEADGKNYHFLDYDGFRAIAGRGNMLEFTAFNGWYYGTPTSSLSPDIVNIGVFNPAGVRALSQSPQVSLAIVYVVTADKVRLLRQLNREENPDVREIIRRYQTDEEDFKHFDDEFAYLQPSLTVNNVVADLDFAVKNVMTVAEEAFGQNQLEDNE